MNNLIKRLACFTLIFSIITTNVYAKGVEVISLGKNLNESQKQEMLNIFDGSKDAKIIEITNEEEVKYLGNYVDRKILGTRAISSSYVRPLKKGSGIKVETYNITWVTSDMLISALATAGVKDAQVKVAAPFPVSGTAALTGVIKGFEDATGESIDEESKQVASEEIVTTGELGEEIGSESASQIINDVKEKVVENNLTDPEEIRIIIREAADNVDIKLTEEQEEKITELMEKISKLDLNVEDIKNQLKNVSDKLKELGKNTEEIKSIVGKILDFVKAIFEKVKNLF